MPKCINCPIVQAKLNPGDLCKECLKLKDKGNLNLENNHDTLKGDSNIIELIRDHMERERTWHEEKTQLLYDQIHYLKSDIIHKNMLIKNIMETTTSNKEYVQSTWENKGIDFNNNNPIDISTSSLTNNNQVN